MPVRPQRRPAEQQQLSRLLRSDDHGTLQLDRPGGDIYAVEIPTDSPAFSRSAQSYGVQHVTDGTSNTIAFAEALVGDANGSEWANNTTNPSRYRGNYLTGGGTSYRRLRARAF